ncbi:helix-turn-helix domain-containing protein [Chryseobacterium gwangjuense]|uniref:helix-turn-helix domain-containing protein n=1 Tax=Chryseobacterium gwangjuense TaxID=1069980 RepID=UPI001E5F5FED|nr:helix-turn-helix domain-containing protein [Chryseobacterium gwangjuense]MCE3075211.1 AraC family transcriptional regulator [Chryseobacterium gwangjuense]
MNAQSVPNFGILTDKAFQKLYQNPEDCISYSQSLLMSDKDIEHKIILRKIISQAYALQGNYVQAVNISNQKDEDITDEKSSSFAQLYGDYNLADQYQNLGLYSQSRKIITDILSNQELLKSKHVKERAVLGKIYQLQAINLGITRSYESALQNLDKSDGYLDEKNGENRIVKQENAIFRATFLMRLNKLEESKKHLDDGIKDIDRHGGSVFLSAFAYETMARYFFLKEDYNTAIIYLEKGLLKIDNLPYNDMKLIYYELLTKNYLALHNDEKYYYYNNLYTDLKTKLDGNKKEGIQYIVKLVETYQNKNIEYQKQHKFGQLKNVSIIVLFFVAGIIVYSFYESGRSKDLKKQLGFFEKQKEREELRLAQANKQRNDIGKENKTSEKDLLKVSKEKEDEILNKLIEWEESDHFLNKNMSISMLSAQTGINTKYLSEVINTTKGKNFNGYVNELRINHIAHLLKTDPAYLNYKVSYLAEYSGFSSHGAFTNVFKSVTGMSPNTYIQEILKNKRE